MPHFARRALRALGVALLLPAALSAQAATLGDPDYLALGRKYFEWAMSGRSDSLVAHMTPEAQEASGGVEGMNQHILQFMSRTGEEQEVVEEKMTRRRGSPQYWRASRYSLFTDEPVVFRWVFSAAGLIEGIGVNPLSQAPPPD